MIGLDFWIKLILYMAFLFNTLKSIQIYIWHTCCLLPLWKLRPFVWADNYLEVKTT